MAAPLRRGRALVRQRVLGLVFLLVLATLVWLTTAIYQKRFEPVAMVTLEADRVGNQMSAGADVKLRGLLVGEVRDVRTSGNGARLRLALQPDKAALLPRDVTARLLPKTLFGEKFVALQLPDAPSGPPLQDGDTIQQDRSATAIETEQVLTDLLPLLQALRPEQLSVTLNAVSGALRGRGEAIGANAERTAAYLRRLNPEMPGLQENVRRLALLAEDYDATAPDLLGLLDNASALSRNLADQQQELERFLAATSGSTADLDGFLRSNERRLVRLAADSLPSLQVYARYSPEFPCVAAGLVRAERVITESFGGLQPGLHITLEPTQDNHGYRPGDEPRNGDDGGPTCRGLPPNPPEIPFPFYRNGVDGYRDGQPVDPRTGVHGSPSPEQPPSAALEPARALAGSAVDDERLTKAIVGTALQQPADEVPDIAALLFGPVARGTTVRLS